MSEEIIYFDSKKGHKIKSVLNYGESKSNKLVTIVHGLGDNPKTHMYYMAKDFFVDKGYDILKVFLYSIDRPLSSLSIKDHVEDVNDVIENMAKVYQDLHIVGHSLGGRIGLLTNLDKVKSLVLWDPIIELNEDNLKMSEYNSSLDKYILKWPVEYILSKEMFEQMSKASYETLVNARKPFKLILAENSFLPQSYVNNLFDSKVDFEEHIVDGANHSFLEEGKLEELYSETLRWLDKF